MSMAIQRSKYTGDPGLGSFLKTVAQAGLGIAGMLPGVGGIAQAASGLLFPPAPGTTTYPQSGGLSRMPPVPIAGPGGSTTQSAQARATQIRHAQHGHGVMPASLSLAAPSGGPCGPGRTEIFGQCVDFSAFPPGGEKFTVPVNGMNGMAMNGMMAGRPAVSGYHWNKSGYFLMSGEYVAPGTKMVKNRRRNPANPRATSNAITRLKGAKRYAQSLSSISIRKKKC